MLETIVLDGNTFLLSIRNQKRAISSQNWALFSFPSFIYVEGRKKYAEGHCLMKDAYRDTTPLSPSLNFANFDANLDANAPTESPQLYCRSIWRRGSWLPYFQCNMVWWAIIKVTCWPDRMKCALCLLPLPLEYIRRALVTQEKEQEKRGLSFPLSFVHFFIIHTRNDFEMPTTSQSVLGERERQKKKERRQSGCVFIIFQMGEATTSVALRQCVKKKKKKYPTSRQQAIAYQCGRTIRLDPAGALTHFFLVGWWWSVLPSLVFCRLSCVPINHTQEFSKAFLFTSSSPEWLRTLASCGE